MNYLNSQYELKQIIYKQIYKEISNDLLVKSSIEFIGIAIMCLKKLLKLIK